MIYLNHLQIKYLHKREKMKFKRHKYNFICLLMILCIGGAAALNFGLFDNQVPNSEIVTPSEGGSSDSLTPGGNGDSNNPSAPGDNPVVEYETDYNMPSVRYPTALLNYCISKMENATGYYGDINFMTTLTGSVAGVAASGQQLCTGHVIKSGDERYEEMRFEALDSMVQQFTPQHNVQAVYTDGTINHFWVTDKGVFDWDQAKYETWTPTNNPHNRKWYYDFLYRGIEGSYGYSGPIEFSNSGSTVSVRSQTNQKTHRDEYIFTVKMVDSTKYPETFLRSFNSFGGTLNIKSFEQTVTFTVDKDSGWILGFVKTDVFKGGLKSVSVVPDSVSSTVNATVTLRFAATYSQHDQIIPITHPVIPTT